MMLGTKDVDDGLISMKTLTTVYVSVITVPFEIDEGAKN